MQDRLSLLKRSLLAAVCSTVLVACGELMVFVTPNPPSAVEGFSKIELNAQGQLDLAWSINSNPVTSKYEIYLLELPEGQTDYSFSDKALTAAPLMSEQLSIPVKDAPHKKGRLLAAVDSKNLVVSDLLRPDRYYLIEVKEENKKTLSKTKVQLVKVEFSRIEASTAVIQNEKIRLNWTSVPGANRYEVYSDEKLTVLLGSNSETFLDLKLSSERAQKDFFVRAFRGDVASEYPEKISLSSSTVRVVKLSSSNPAGLYKEGDYLSFSVEFSDTVSAEGNLELPLQMGNLSRRADYVSGSGTKTLVYNYNIQAGDDCETLEAGLLLVGEYQDQVGLNIAALLPTDSTANELKSKTLEIDTLSPSLPSSIGFASALSLLSQATVNWSSALDANLLRHEVMLCGVNDCASSCSAPLSVATGTSQLLTGVNDGSYYACVRAEDSAGHLTPWVASFFQLTVNTSGPAAPVISSSNLTTNDTTPSVSGTAEPSMDIKLYADGILVGSSASDANGAWSISSSALSSGAHVVTAIATNAGAHDSPSSNAITITIDTQAPTVTAVGSTYPNASYGVATVIPIAVSFSEAVNVIGIPTLTLEAGAIDPNAVYVSGSGTSTLIFEYTVGVDEQAADLDYKSTSALSGSIQDLAGNAANLGLPNPGLASSLGGSKSIVIDALVPRVTSISSLTADGAYGPGNVISIQVNFSRTVSVAGGTPTLSINTSPTKNLSYTSGSGTGVLTFNYTVATGETSSDLDAASTSALLLNGASLVDTVSNHANLTLPTPGAASSLSISRAIMVAGNSVAPSVAASPSSQNAYVGIDIASVDVSQMTPAGDLDADGESISYSCRYDTTVDGAMDGTAMACSSLPNNNYSFNSSGVLQWNPSVAANSSYTTAANFEFEVTATDNSHLSSKTYFTIAVIRPFSSTIPYTSGTGYTFDSSSVEFVSGKARLIEVDQSDESNTGGFQLASGLGAAWNSSKGAMDFGNAGGCDGTLKNCVNTLDQGQPASLYHFPFEGSPFVGYTVHSLPVATTDSKIGLRAISFDGVNQSAYISRVVSDDFTFNFWIKTTNSASDNTCSNWTDGPGIVSMEVPGIVNDYGIQMCGGYITAGVGNPDITLKSLQPYNDNRWHMVTFTRTKSTGVINLYVDAVLQQSAVGNTSTLDAHAFIDIGKRNSGAAAFWSGVLDELQIYISPLTETNIAYLYSRQASKRSAVMYSRIMDSSSAASTWTSIDWATSLPFGKELPGYASGSLQNESNTNYSALSTNSLVSGLLGLWHFNETTADTGPSASDYKDSSGQGNHGAKNSNVTMAKLGRFASGARFNGSGLVDLGTAPALEFGTSTSFSAAVWFKSRKYYTAPDTGRVISNGFDGTDNGWALEMSLDTVSFGIGCGGGSAANCAYITANGSYNDNAWHHALAVVDRTAQKIKLYVDGKEQSISKNASFGDCGTIVANELDISSCTNLNANRSIPSTLIGGSQSSDFLDADMDELAVWGRSLSAAEALDIYRRGANRVSIQLRSCTASDCNGASWKGPGGNYLSYYSELLNNTTPLTALGDVKTALPGLSLPAFTPIADARYFQYRVFLESDEVQGLCAGSNCSPDLKSVAIGPAPRYNIAAPSLSYNTAIPFYTLSSMSETTSCAASVRYQLSVNNSSWFYWDGVDWVASNGSYAQSNPVATLSSNASTFAAVVGRTNLYVKAVLGSNGLQSCELDSTTISGNSQF